MTEKLHIIFAAFASLLLVSCTNVSVDPDPVVTNDGAPIRFSMSTEGADTKALLNDTDFQTDSTAAQVWDAFFSNTSDDPISYIDGSYVVGQTAYTSGENSTNWPFYSSLDNRSEQLHYYWTLAGSHRFYGVMAYDAYSQLAAPGATLPSGANSAWDSGVTDWGWGTLSSYSSTSDVTKNRTFFVPTQGTESSYHTQNLSTPQYDFVYSDVVTRDLDNEKASDGASNLKTTVPLEFSHLFSAFAITLENDGDADVTISKITMPVLTKARATVDYTSVWDSQTAPLRPEVQYYASTDPYLQVKEGVDGEDELDWSSDYTVAVTGDATATTDYSSATETFSCPLTADGDVIIPCDTEDSKYFGAKIDVFRSSATPTDDNGDGVYSVPESTYEDGTYTLVWPQYAPTIDLKITMEVTENVFTWVSSSSVTDFSSGVYYYPNRLEYKPSKGDYSIVSTADNTKAGSFTFTSRNLGLTDSEGNSITSVTDSDGKSFSNVVFCDYSGNYNIPIIENFSYEADANGDWDIGAYLAYTNAKLGEYTVTAPAFTYVGTGGEFNLGTADSYTQDSGSRYYSIDDDGNATWYYLGTDGNYYSYAEKHDGSYNMTGGTLVAADNNYGEWRVRPYLIWKGEGQGSYSITEMILSYDSDAHGEYLLSGDATSGSCMLFSEAGNADWNATFHAWRDTDYAASGLYSVDFGWSGKRTVETSIDLAEVRDQYSKTYPYWEPGCKYLYNLTFSSLTANLSVTVVKWDGGHGGTVTFE